MSRLLALLLILSFSYASFLEARNFAIDIEQDTSVTQNTDFNFQQFECSDTHHDDCNDHHDCCPSHHSCLHTYLLSSDTFVNIQYDGPKESKKWYYFIHYSNVDLSPELRPPLFS